MIPSIDQLSFFNQNVVLRVDWNIPTKDILQADGKSTKSLKNENENGQDLR